MLCQFLGAALVGGLLVEHRVRCDRPAEYHVVYHAKSGDQFGARLRRKQRTGRVLDGNKQSAAGTGDLLQTPRVRRQ